MNIRFPLTSDYFSIHFWIIFLILEYSCGSCPKTYFLQCSQKFLYFRNHSNLFLIHSNPIFFLCSNSLCIRDKERKEDVTCSPFHSNSCWSSRLNHLKICSSLIPWLLMMLNHASELSGCLFLNIYMNFGRQNDVDFSSDDFHSHVSFPLQPC